MKLKYLDAWNEARRERARWYREAFAREACDGIKLPDELPDRCHVYHLFVIRAKERDRLQRELARRGVQTTVYYPRPLHVDSIYAGTTASGGDLTKAEQAAKDVLALPLYPELEREAVNAVVRSVKEVLASLRVVVGRSRT